MRRLLSVFGMMLVLIMGYALSDTTVPKLDDLQEIVGVFVPAQPGSLLRHPSASYAEISIRSANNTYQLRTYDLSVLQHLREGVNVRAKIFARGLLGTQEIWELSTGDGFERTYDEIYSARLPEIVKFKWCYALFSIGAIFIAFHVNRERN